MNIYILHVQKVFLFYVAILPLQTDQTYAFEFTSGMFLFLSPYNSANAYHGI